MNTPRTSSSTSLAKELTLIPGISLPSNLSPLRINEITNFRSKKIKEYQQVLETCLSESLPVTNSQSPYAISKRERLKVLNKQRDNKREEISQKREEEEIKRITQSQYLKLTSVYNKLKINNEKMRMKQAIKEKIERQKAIKEKKKQEESTKNLVIENINNFYTDRINILKEKIRKEKSRNQIKSVEKKKIVSQIKKEQQLKKKNNLVSSFII